MKSTRNPPEIHHFLGFPRPPWAASLAPPPPRRRPRCCAAPRCRRGARQRAWCGCGWGCSPVTPDAWHRVVRCPIFVTFEGQEVMLMAIESPIIGKMCFFTVVRLSWGFMANWGCKNQNWGTCSVINLGGSQKKKLGYPSGHQIYRVGPLKGDVSGQSLGMVYVISPGFHQDFDVTGLV